MVSEVHAIELKYTYQNTINVGGWVSQVLDLKLVRSVLEIINLSLPPSLLPLSLPPSLLPLSLPPSLLPLSLPPSLPPDL